jgi:uracil-DNA glycosylase
MSELLVEDLFGRGDDARAYFPAERTLGALRAAAQACRACPLYENARNIVFGEGPADAQLALVAEQPGDEEDKAGRGFIGPSGQLLNSALKDAGIQRERVYISGAVKHFKHEVRGKRRLHRTPDPREIAACRPWLHEELRIVRPKVLVLMGTTAVHSVLGRPMTLRGIRGRVFASPFSARTIVTCHPAAVLRTFDEQSRGLAYDQLVAELTLARSEIEQP